MSGDAQNLNVDPERIRTHATNVEKLSVPLAQALEAARAVSAPSDAFGKLCVEQLFVDRPEALRLFRASGSWAG
ncbi:hypothetical protein [Nocardia sp. NPDC051463]|uniref:type VII secretion target n=1 Tax=Nocardia sp. NPDC051463 TaxID=3154845 RepID=UPI00342AD04F